MTLRPLITVPLILLAILTIWLWLPVLRLADAFYLWLCDIRWRAFRCGVIKGRMEERRRK